MAPRFLSAGVPLVVALLAASATRASAAEGVIELTTTELAWRIAVCVAMVGLAAMFSGLTLAVMSQDPNQLQIITEAGSPRDRKYAARILTEALPTSTVPNFTGAQWTKLVINMVNALPAITGTSVQEVVADRGLRRIMTASMRESVARPNVAIKM